MQTDVPGKYRFLDHPADLMIEGVGVTLEESWSNVIVAAFTQIQAGPGIPVQKTFTVSASRLPSLLFDLLSEIIARVETKRFVPSKVTMLTVLKPQRPGEPFSVTCTVAGTIVEQLENPIKAVTYHQMQIQFGTGKVTTTVVFDI